MSLPEPDRAATEHEHENSGSGVPDDREELLEQIHETREELGATVEALAHKADVKAQVQERKDQLHQMQAEATGRLRSRLDNPIAPAAIAAVGALLLVLQLRRRRR